MSVIFEMEVHSPMEAKHKKQALEHIGANVTVVAFGNWLEEKTGEMVLPEDEPSITVMRLLDDGILVDMRQGQGRSWVSRDPVVLLPQSETLGHRKPTITLIVTIEDAISC